LRTTGAGSGTRRHDAPRRATGPADGGLRGPDIRALERRAPRDIRAGGRCEHRQARQRVLRLMLQTAFNALALGSVYALMAVGVGLVFGVLRLVNFAYGQLIMAGAYALAIGSEHNWPQWASVLACFGVVIALSLLMEIGLFRPLRGASPATMLVATFAVAFLLQSIALLKFGPLVKTASIFPGLFDPIGHGQFEPVRRITVGAVVALGALTLLLAKTTIGLHMRAASADFRTARFIGVRANAVVTLAVVLSGVLAAVVSVILVVEDPFVEPQFALRDTIIVL